MAMVYLEGNKAMRPRGGTPGAWPINKNHLAQELTDMKNPTTKPTGYVYAVESPTLKRIKIGFSANVATRFASLRCASPDDLVLIGCWPGALADEQSLHEWLASWRLHGEWFEASPVVREVVSHCIRVQASRVPSKLILDYHPDPFAVADLDIFATEMITELDHQEPNREALESLAAKMKKAATAATLFMMEAGLE